MQRILAERLKPGDEIRVIAPSRSMSIISDDIRSIANETLGSLGYKVTYGRNVDSTGPFKLASIKERIDDLHEAFGDPNVKAVLTAIGGLNSNQLLPYIDWNLIRDNPKIFCGYSDITILTNAVFAKTGLVTYLGPHHSTFGILMGNEYTVEHFQKAVTMGSPFSVSASDQWSDDAWYLDQHAREFLPNPGPKTIIPGTAQGVLVGGNAGTFSLLQGTPYMPSLEGTILLYEEDNGEGDSTGACIDRWLTSIMQQPDFEGVKGILIGRGQKATDLDYDTAQAIIATKSLRVPVVYGLDFGHTSPLLTLPIGGRASFTANEGFSLEILDH